MKKYCIIFFSLSLSFTAISGQETDFYFFSKSDIKNIKENSTSDNGKNIVDSLRQLVGERLQYPMEVPMLEGGHSHDYFCPEHNIRFTFDWNSPTAHYCELCNKHWTKINKFNWAWVNMVHNRNLDFLNACTYLLIATDEKQYAGYIKNLLSDYASKYPTYMLHNTRRQQVERESGKMYGQSLDEAVFSSYAARAFLTAKSQMSDKEIAHIERGYLRPCSELLLRQTSGGNWQVWHNSGIIALGVALQNDSIIDVALNNPQRGYYKLMQLHVNEDGWWNEGSPTYHFYPLRAMMLSAEALRCRNINLYDRRLYNMFASPARGVYSNLQFPSHNDGWYGESLLAQAHLYEMATVRFDDATLENVLAKIYRQTARNAVEMLQSNKKPSNKTVNEKRESVNFPDIGVSVLCSGDKTVVIKYGTHGGTHGHPDKLSIAIHDGEKEILTDMGTPGYGVPDYHRWYRKTLSHSTLSVDGQDQQATTGELLKFVTYKNGGVVEVRATDAYEGVDMQRSLELKGNKLTDIFTATSDKEHTYDYVLILTEKPVFDYPTIAAELNNSEAYKQIKQVRQVKNCQSFSFSVSGYKIKTQLLNIDKFDVFIGEASGIPYRNIHLSGNIFEQSKVYPLIVRVKSKNIKLVSNFEF